MMTTIFEKILSYLQIKEIKAQEVDESTQGEKRRFWPHFSLSLGAAPCEDVDDEGGGDKKEQQELQATVVFEIEEEEEEEEEREEKNDKYRSGPSALSRKLGCMYHSGKHGLREGALSGIFFGGALGIYKYIKAVKSDKGDKNEEEGDEGGENSGENGSTVNDNIIFVTATNGAIAMSVFCTFYCCLKAAIYCN